MADTLPIPPIAHFIWYGASLPPIPYLAIRAAMERSGLQRAVLHSDNADLVDDPRVRWLSEDPRFSFEPFDAASVFGQAMHDAIGEAASERLRGIYRLLRSPASRANIVRLAVLARVGGVYIDADAITVADLTDLRRDPGFAGLERIALPDHVRSSRNPLRWAGAGALLGIREAFARLPAGPAMFASVQGLYALAANNAVMGASPDHRLVRRALADAAQTPAEHVTRRFELGTRLLQRVTENRSSADFVMHPPAVFFPQPPEVSWHFFRRRPAERDSELTTPETRAVHLYDSVAQRRLGRPLDAAWILAQGDSTPLSRMVAPWRQELERLYPG